MRRALLAVAVSLAGFFALCAARAQAAAEACPAQIERLTPRGAASRAAEYVYELDALSRRTVDATVVADTSAGWFTWNAARVALTEHVHYTDFSHYADAVSLPLGVVFPSAVTVRHAWVTQAKSSGETLMGWDARGVYDCGVPAFSDDTVTELASAPFPHPAPAPLSAAPASSVNAVATAAPFPAAHCATPFSRVTVTNAVTPHFPAGLPARMTAIVTVTVDAQGHVLDAAMRYTSGSRDADVSATQAAAASTYAAGTSYCQPAGGQFLFRADFNPNE